MNTEEVIKLVGEKLKTLPGNEFDLLTISQPISSDAAVNLAKVISKLYPLLGNLIEFNITEFLNAQNEFQKFGK